MKATRRIDVGKRVREIRKNAGLSMKELAEKVGVSFLTIQRIETGKVSPSVALLSEIAYHLNYPLASLVAEGKPVSRREFSDHPKNRDGKSEPLRRPPV